MSDQLQWFERSLAALEHKHDELVRDFHVHAEQAVHTGFVDVLQEIRGDLKTLQARWLQVGGTVIMLLLTILLSLLGVLWALLRPGLPLSAPTSSGPPGRPVCSQFGSQAAAQEFYRANPIAGRVLDGDRDGLSCEDNPAPYDWAAVTTAP